VVLKVPENYNGAENMSQDEVNSAFTDWMAVAAFTGGIGSELVTVPESPAPPSSCGGNVTVEWVVTSDCEEDVTGSTTFRIPYASPVAVNDAATANENTPVSIPVLGNDTDCSNSINPGSVEVVAGPENGTVTINHETGSVTYTPDQRFSGTNEFTYIVCNAAGLCDHAVVTVTVVAVNQPPVAVDDQNETIINTPVSGQVTENDNDPDGDQLAVSLTPVKNPANGTVTLWEDGHYTYIPNTDYTGTDYFEYRICDPGGLCDIARVTIIIEGCPLFIPDGFSPNDDGNNDYFRMLCLQENYPDARIEIYNRWGNLIYEQDKYGREDRWWDGRSNKKRTFGNEKLPPGTYFYILYKNDGSDPITGYVFLNR
jgi:gliding motility-associated-like protein